MIKDNEIFLVTAGAALPLGSLLYYVNVGKDLPSLLFYIFVSAIFSYAVLFLLRSNRACNERKKQREDFIGYLHRIVYRRTGGESYFRAVENAPRDMDSVFIRNAAERASRRFLLGENFLENLRSLAGLSDYAPIGDSGAQPRDIIRSYDLYLRSKSAEVESTTQRDATFNMFISTILPSFLVFAFIGNAILSETSTSTYLFSIILLLLIPLVYSVGNALMWRRLLA